MAQKNASILKRRKMAANLTGVRSLQSTMDGSKAEGYVKKRLNPSMKLFLEYLEEIGHVAFEEPGFSAAETYDKMTTSLGNTRDELRAHFMGDTNQILPQDICLFLDSTWKKEQEDQVQEAPSADSVASPDGRKTKKKRISHGRLLHHKTGELRGGLCPADRSASH